MVGVAHCIPLEKGALFQTLNNREDSDVLICTEGNANLIKFLYSLNWNDQDIAVQGCVRP